MSTSEKYISEALVKDKAKLPISLRIKDGSVVTEKLADGAVTTGKVADKAIVSSKLASHSVVREKLGEDVLSELGDTAEALDDAVYHSGESYGGVPAPTGETIESDYRLDTGDFQIDGGRIQLADRDNSLGMGYKVLRPHHVVEDRPKVVLTARSKAYYSGMLHVTFDDTEYHVELAEGDDAATVMSKVYAVLKEALSTDYLLSLEGDTLTIVKRYKTAIADCVVDNADTNADIHVENTAEHVDIRRIGQDDFDLEDCIYEVRYDADLDDREIVVPKGCVLRFNGGGFSNGGIVYDNTVVSNFDSCSGLDDVAVTGACGNKAVYPEYYGAKGDGVTDDSIPLDNWMKNGGTLCLSPNRTYIVGTILHYGIDHYRNSILRIYSDTIINGNHSTIKLKDNVLSKGWQYNCHLIAGDDVSNVEIYNTVFDGNGINNLTPVHDSSHHTSAMFMRIVGGEDIYIHDNILKDCAGHNMLVFNIKAKNFSHENATVANNVRVEDNVFSSGGIYLSDGKTAKYNENNPDFSFVYTEFAHSAINNNHIENFDLSTNAIENLTVDERLDIVRGRKYGKFINSGGIEIHNKDSEVIGNTIIGCSPAIFLSANYGDMNNVTVSNNNIKSCIQGVNIVAYQIANSYNDLAIRNNSFDIINNFYDNVCAIVFSYSNDNCRMNRVTIEGNSLSQDETVDDTGIMKSSYSLINLIGIIDDISIKSNIVYKSVFQAIRLERVGNATIRENIIKNSFINKDVAIRENRNTVSSVDLYTDSGGWFNNVHIEDNSLVNDTGYSLYAFSFYKADSSSISILGNDINGYGDLFNNKSFFDQYSDNIYNNTVCIRNRSVGRRLYLGDIAYVADLNKTYNVLGTGYLNPTYTSANMVKCSSKSSRVITITDDNSLKVNDKVIVVGDNGNKATMEILCIDGNDYTLSAAISWEATGIYQNSAVLLSAPRSYGISSLRPTLDAVNYMGFQYYDLTLKKPIYWNNTKWLDANGNDVDATVEDANSEN